MRDNPLSEGISHVRRQFTELEFDSIEHIVPSSITAVVLVIVGLVLCALWPYGLVVIMEDLLRSLMEKTRDEMENEETLAGKTPFAITIGLYFVVWAPFAVLSLPFVVIGAIGAWFLQLTVEEQNADTGARGDRLLIALGVASFVLITVGCIGAVLLVLLNR